MREITTHVVNPANDKLKIQVLDEPGQGGACHSYEVSLPDGERYAVNFQDGPIDGDGGGVNGLTHEVLLAIVIDRLEGFQNGKFACEDNQKALDHLRGASQALHSRTLARMGRGVEGTHAV